MLRHLFQEEYFPEDVFELLTEQQVLPPGVIMRIQGPIGITEKENRNKRIYTNELWEKVLSDKDVKKDLKDRALVGSADHPKSFVPPIATVSHVLTDAWIDKDKNALMGKFDILNTPMGKIVKTMYEAKVKIGASTRSAGASEKKEGKNYVQFEGFKWGGADLCFRPSAQNAYPRPVTESIEKIIKESSILDLGDNEESKELYKNLFERTGCNVSLLMEKYNNGSEDVNGANEEEDDVDAEDIVLFFSGDANSFKESLKGIKNSILFNEQGCSAIKFTSKKDSYKARKVITEKNKVEVIDSHTMAEAKRLKEISASLSEQVIKLSQNTKETEKVQNLTKELDLLKEKVSISSKEVSTLKNENATLQSQKDEVESQLDSLKRNLGKNDTGADILKLQEENEVLTKRLSDSDQDLAEANKTIKKLEMSLSDLEGSTKELDGISEDFYILVDEKARIQCKLRAANEDCKTLEQEVKETRVKYYSLRLGLSEKEIIEEGMESMNSAQIEEFYMESYSSSEEEMEPAPKVLSFSVSNKGRKFTEKLKRRSEIINLIGNMRMSK